MSANLLPRALGLLLCAAAATSLSACVGGPASLGGEPPLTPTSRYVLQVEPGLDRVALAVREDGLSAAQQAAVADLADRFALEGAAELVVEAPSGDDAAAAQAAFNVKAALEQAGVPSAMIRVVSYAAPDPRAPVLAGFETVQAAVPRCGTQWGNLSRTGDNRSASNFGCAVTANLAAQIENPRDIRSPRALSASDAGRRTVVFDAYRRGERTAAAREELIEGNRISRAVD